MPVLLNDLASLTVNQFRRYIAYNALDQRAILIAGFGGKLGRQLCGLRRGIQVEGLIFTDKAVGAFRDFVGAAVIDNGFYLQAFQVGLSLRRQIIQMVGAIEQAPFNPFAACTAIPSDIPEIIYTGYRQGSFAKQP